MRLNLHSGSNNVFIRRVWVVVISCCLILFQIAVCTAQQEAPAAESESETGDEKKNDQPWQPPVPTPGKFDWIQLTSEEWLKGELKRLYESKLEFDSDELGLLEFNWEDVKLIRGHRSFTVLFEGPITVEGLLEVTEDKVFMTVGEERREFDRNQLVAIVPEATREIDYWTAKVTFGLNLTRGNTEETQLSTIANIKRRTVNTRFVADWLGNYSSTGGERTIDNQRLSLFFDLFRTRKYFLRPVFGEYFRDPFSNISSRVTVGTAIGYHLIDTAKTEWDISGGPAYQQTRFVSVPAGQNESESTPALVAGTFFDTELTRKVDFEFRYNFQIVNEQSGTYTHHTMVALETELTGWLDFDVALVWDRIQDPQPAADGSVPKQDDYYFIIGLGIDI